MFPLCNQELRMAGRQENMPRATSGVLDVAVSGSIFVRSRKHAMTASE